MQRNTSGATRSSRKAGNENRGKASRRGTEGTVRNAVRVGAGGKERYLYRHNENKEVPENAEVHAVRYGYAVGAEKGTGRTVRRNWRQVAGLRPSVHQVGRKSYEQQYSYFWFKEFCEKNSIRFCDIHSLRHLHASLLINAGVDVVAVSGDLGHSQVSTTTNIYCHMFQEAQTRTSRAIADALIFDKKRKAGRRKSRISCLKTINSK